MADKTILTLIQTLSFRIACLKKDIMNGSMTGEAHGQILYVSKDGNNATAVKGDGHKPWAEPWSAVAAASAGDTVFIFPGEYLLGDGEQGFEVDFESADPTVATLLKDQVHIHCVNGVVIKNYAIDEPIYLFYNEDSTQDINFSLTGDGEFHPSANVVESRFMFLCTDRTAGAEIRINFECKKIVYRDDWCFLLRSGTKEANIKVKEVEASVTRAGGFLPFVFTNTADETSTNLIKDAVFNIEIDSYVYNIRAFIAVPGTDFNTIFTIRGVERSNAHIKIGTITGYYMGYGALLTLGGPSKNSRDNRVTMDIGVIDLANGASVENFVYSEAVTAGGSLEVSSHINGLVFLYNQNSIRATEENDVTINIGNVRGAVSVGGYLNLRVTGAGPSKNSIVYNVGNIYMEGSYPCVFNEVVNSTGTSAAVTTKVNIIGRASSALGSPILLPDDSTSGHLIISGRYYSGDTNRLVAAYCINNTEVVTLEKCYLFNSSLSGVVGPLTPGNSKTFKTVDARTGNLTVNPDVVYTIDGMNRSSLLI